MTSLSGRVTVAEIEALGRQALALPLELAEPSDRLREGSAGGADARAPSP